MKTNFLSAVSSILFSAMPLCLVLTSSLVGCATVNPNTLKDVSNFSKSMDWNDDFFEIRSADGKLTIRTFGQDDGNEVFEQQINGTVIGAEAADLNKDGFPEILVFVSESGPASYGNVIGYSSNNGKSMSPIVFPATISNSQINQGYRGFDTFSTAEDTLVQTFPVFRPQDLISNPTGPTRQVQYVLVDGAPMRRLAVARSFEN